MRKIREAYEKRETNRNAFLEAVAAATVEGTLEALGFPKERAHVWYNIHTGDEETLGSMLNYDDLMSAFIPLERQPEELGYILEDWLPRESNPNPVMARSLAMSEYDAMQQLAEHMREYIDRNDSADSFIDDVHTTGGSLPDGGYNCHTKNGKAVVELHDGREFTFPLRALYDAVKQSETQAALF